jgi:hypothetical protein
MAGMLRPAPNRSPSANLTCWSCLPCNPEMVYCIGTKHYTLVPSTVDMYIRSTYTAAHLAINLSPPNLPPTFTPGPEVQDGLGANARNSWPSLSRVCHSFNRLGIHSRSSSSASATKPIPDLPALPSQSADARSHDPMSLGGNRRPWLAHLVTRSNPACLGDYTEWPACFPIS